MNSDENKDIKGKLDSGLNSPKSLKALTEKLNNRDKDLEEEREVYKFLAENSNDGYWDWKMDKDIPFEEQYEYMSPRFWEIFGYSPEEKEHKVKAWMDMINKEDGEAAVENLNKHIKSKGKTPYKQTVRYTHKDGSTVWVLCKGAVVKWNEDGSASRMIGTHTDVTEIMNSKNNK